MSPGPPFPKFPPVPPSPIKPLREVLRQGHQRVGKAGEDIRSIAEDMRGATTTAPQTAITAPPEQNPTPTITEPGTTPKKEDAGTACDICSLDHISTCAGILEEANRFARREGIDNPEVIRRISICRQQLNALERDDANPQKLVELPPIERKIMERILPKAGKLRHRLNEIVSLETLEQVTAETQDLSDQFQNDIFHLQRKRKSEELSREMS
ncbi:hypothetical protein ES708_03285 [subsurface metagenome]